MTPFSKISIILGVVIVLSVGVIIGRISIKDMSQNPSSFLGQLSNIVEQTFLKNNTKDASEEISLIRESRDSISTSSLQEKIKIENVIVQKKCITPTSSQDDSHTVIFHEIAWMGNPENTQQEWIELYNRGTTTISLAEWEIRSQSENIHVLFPSFSKIFGNDIYILARNTRERFPFEVDFRYKGALRNQNETLWLINDHCEIVDVVFANPSWQEGSSKEKKTMERTTNDFLWYTSQYSGGTPGRANSTPPFITSTSTFITTSSLFSVSSSTTKLQNNITGILSSGISQSLQNTVSSSLSQNLEPKLCVQENLGNPTHTVLINEVAWAGTGSTTTSHEWIELKNPENVSRVLSGWQLVNKTNEIQVFFTASDTIPAQDFYLLERTDDTRVPVISANKIFTNTIHNSDETLRLFDAQCTLIDEVSADNGVGKIWLAGETSPGYRTAERSQDLTLHTYNGNGNNGIFGTPKAENSLPPVSVSSLSSGGGAIQFTSTTFITNPISFPTLRVSEIMVGIEGDANYEFIELFNPTQNPIDLTGWFIKKKTSSGAEQSLLVADRLTEKTINAGKYFLIANSATSTISLLPDAVWAISNTLAYTNNAIVLYNAHGEKVDEVTWTEIPKGKSFVRTSWESNQFTILDTPTPYNSQSF